MVLTYKQCIEKYGSDHMLKKEILSVDEALKMRR